MVLWRLTRTGVYVLLGLGVGFALWGSRVSNLTASLDMMTLQDENLRSRLAQQQRPGADDDTALLTTLSLLSSEVSLQADLIEKQSLVLEQLTSGREEKLTSSLARCTQTETRLEGQLEACLFSKASLERTVAKLDAHSNAAPRRGSAEIKTSVRSAQEVMEEVNGKLGR